MPQRPSIADAAWIPVGQTVIVGGFTISSGHFYLGRHHLGRHSADVVHSQRWHEPSVVDTSLPVDARASESASTYVSYINSYSNLTPTGRATYLRWLADGRCAPDIDISYVFLYFFGLERRLLVDGRYLPDAQRERKELTDELYRLMSVYSHDSSFVHFANLLLAVAIPADGRRRYLDPPPTTPYGWELPFDLRHGIGQLILDRKPIPADWALAWLRLNPEAWLRTPATRCADEFDEVFVNRYREKFGEGLRIEPEPAMLSNVYYPVSPAIAGGPVQGSIPDVAALKEPFAELREIGRAACTDLDEYSRYMGRHPDAAGTAAALVLLPPSLHRDADPASDALPRWAEECLGGAELVEVAGSDVISMWPYSDSGRLGKADAIVLARLLEGRGIGVVPDVRFGGAVLTSEMSVVLFRRAARPASAPSGPYVAAAAVMQLAAAVAAADGTMDGAERSQIESHIASKFRLGDDESRRLRAHLAFALRHPPAPAALRKQAAKLTEAQQRDAGDLLVDIAAAQGVVALGKVDALIRLFPALGLDPARIPRRVTMPNPNDELTPLTTAGAQARYYAIPKSAEVQQGQGNAAIAHTQTVAAQRLEVPPSGRPAGEAPPALHETMHLESDPDSARAIRLDAERTEPWNHANGQPGPPQVQRARPAVILDPDLLAARITDSERAASYLAQVFAEEDAISPFPNAPRPLPDAANMAVAGLDGAHSELLRRLAARPQWSRSEFDSLAGEVGLLPDGALDTINEAAVEVAGEPVCEGAELITLNHLLVEELLR
jgi:TerB-like protein/tellurite resistance protein TerB